MHDAILTPTPPRRRVQRPRPPRRIGRSILAISLLSAVLASGTTAALVAGLTAGTAASPAGAAAASPAAVNAIAAQAADLTAVVAAATPLRRHDHVRIRSRPTGSRPSRSRPRGRLGDRPERRRLHPHQPPRRGGQHLA